MEVMQEQYKDSKVGVIPIDWDCLSMSDVVSNFRGGASFKPNEFTKEGVKVLSKIGITSGGKMIIPISKQQFCESECLKKYKKSIASKSDHVPPNWSWPKIRYRKLNLGAFYNAWRIWWNITDTTRCSQLLLLRRPGAWFGYPDAIHPDVTAAETIKTAMCENFPGRVYLEAIETQKPSFKILDVDTSPRAQRHDDGKSEIFRDQKFRRFTLGGAKLFRVIMWNFGSPPPLKYWFRQGCDPVYLISIWQSVWLSVWSSVWLSVLAG